MSEIQLPIKSKPIQISPPKMFLLPKKDEMKNGEIRKLPTANSPMWTTQYAVQGTAAKPYVVSRRTKAAGIPVDSWSCSCPNWTKHSPRTECKHILSVIVKEKFTVPAGPASMDKETAKEFAAFQKSRARKAANVKEDWGIAEGRKFR